MKVPLPFPHSISSHEMLVELAAAIRFFLRAAPGLTPGMAALKKSLASAGKKKPGKVTVMKTKTRKAG